MTKEKEIEKFYNVFTKVKELKFFNACLEFLYKEHNKKNIQVNTVLILALILEKYRSNQTKEDSREKEYVSLSYKEMQEYLNVTNSQNSKIRKFLKDEKIIKLEYAHYAKTIEERESRIFLEKDVVDKILKYYR